MGVGGGGHRSSLGGCGCGRECAGVRDCARVYVDLHGGTHEWVG